METKTISSARIPTRSSALPSIASSKCSQYRLSLPHKLVPTCYTQGWVTAVKIDSVSAPSDLRISHRTPRCIMTRLTAMLVRQALRADDPSPAVQIKSSPCLASGSLLIYADRFLPQLQVRPTLCASLMPRPTYYLSSIWTPSPPPSCATRFRSLCASTHLSSKLVGMLDFLSHDIPTTGVNLCM